ncbi:MAG: MerR family transcriptional regulator [Deltaproteobacteria bacterium]|nr:MerR family transcriptional regulator [Deltaproteobacteria bacterium]
MGPQAIPQKLYYRLGEVAEVAGVKEHVLRYWEAEFAFRASGKDEGNQGLYTQKDLEKVLAIKKLLVEERHSVASAKKRLRDEIVKVRDADPREERKRLLRQVLSEVGELVNILDRP